MKSFSADSNSRGGAPMGSLKASVGSRGGFGAEQDEGTLSDSLPGNIHSSRGFRRALMKSTRSGGGASLSSHLPSQNDFSGSKFKKPNYAFQGGQRHGMHIGQGSPATIPAEAEGFSA